MQSVRSGAAKKLRLALKASFAAFLLYWVWHSGMVDFHSVATVLLTPADLGVALSLLLFSALLCALRWSLLVRMQGLNTPFSRILELTFIGAFFNSFLPGAVGGDFIKAWYAAGREPTRKTRAVFSILLDRLVGLWAILSFGAFATLACFSRIRTQAKLESLALVLWASTLGLAVASLILVRRRITETRGVAQWLDRAKHLPLVSNLSGSFDSFFKNGRTVMYAALLSLVASLANLALYIFLGHELGVQLSLSQYFFIVPIAVTVSAIPVLPGGLGVGQVAFHTLFLWSGAANSQQGATLCTLVQAYTLLFNCSGIVPYLRMKADAPPKTSLTLAGAAP